MSSTRDINREHRELVIASSDLNRKEADAFSRSVVKRLEGGER